MAAGLAAILAPLAAQAAGDAAAGEEAFLDRCVMCHVAEGGGQGPSLTGVVGRKAAGKPGFAYSPAMQGAGFTWTRDRVEQFLANPPAMVPGTAMPILVQEAKVRQDIATYLETLKAPTP